MDARRPWAGSTARYGTLGDHGEWRLAIEHYYWDRLEPAFEIAEGLGLSYGAAYGTWYRLIESEHTTRRRSKTSRVNDWLELETIPEESEGVDGLAAVVLRACEDVGRRLGWEHGAPTLVSVLAKEADAPWAVGRYGYMMDKYPFDKVCVPNRSLWDERELRRVVSHEYAHVVSLNLSQGLVPRWLDEAVAQVADRDEDLNARADFASGRAPWLNAHDLQLAFGAEREEAIGGRRLWMAYAQSAEIGRYLVSQGGEGKLGDLLRGFSNNSLWTDLKLRVTGQPEEEEALQEVYGFSTAELFERTLNWLKGAAFS